MSSGKMIWPQQNDLLRFLESEFTFGSFETLFYVLTGPGSRFLDFLALSTPVSHAVMVDWYYLIVFWHGVNFSIFTLDRAAGLIPNQILFLLFLLFFVNFFFCLMVILEILLY